MTTHFDLEYVEEYLHFQYSVLKFKKSFTFMLQEIYGEFHVTSVRVQHDFPPQNFAAFVLSIGSVILQVSM
jgi:hypothetical protein